MQRIGEGSMGEDFSLSRVSCYTRTYHDVAPMGLEIKGFSFNKTLAAPMGLSQNETSPSPIGEIYFFLAGRLELSQPHRGGMFFCLPEAEHSPSPIGAFCFLFAGSLALSQPHRGVLFFVCRNSELSQPHRGVLFFVCWKLSTLTAPSGRSVFCLLEA
jgi:hypothetical protein